MKKILSVIIILAVFLTSCLKDDTINTEGGLISTGTIIELPYTGLAYFGNKSVIVAGTDPIEDAIVINIAATRGVVFDKALNVTLGVDDAARVAYNATSDIKYEAMPDSCYAFPDKIGVIPAGQYLDTLYISFFPDKINPTKNYMLPVAIKDAEGQVISGNFSIAYYHTIGNPIAGAYTWDFYRWNNETGTGPVGGGSFLGDSELFLPASPEMVQMHTGYFTQPRYQLSFTNTGGVLTDFSLQFNPEDLDADFTANAIEVKSGPFILLADPIAGHYKFQYTVWNGAAYRYLIDEYYK